MLNLSKLRDFRHWARMAASGALATIEGGKSVPVFPTRATRPTLVGTLVPSVAPPKVARCRLGHFLDQAGNHRNCPYG